MILLRILPMLLTLLILLGSCNDILFQTPQPIDESNLKHIPKSLRGTWVNELDTIRISKTHYQTISHHIDGINLTLEDSMRTFSIHEDLIYYDYGGEMRVGRILNRQADSLTYEVRNVEEIWLNNKNIMREFGEYYMVNTQEDDDYNWWSLTLINVLDNKDIVLRKLSDDDIAFIEEKDVLLTTDRLKYVSTRWTGDQIQGLISKGMFSDTLMVLEEKYRVEE